MGRGPRCSKDGLNKGAWMAAEDKLLMDYVKSNGEGKWSNVAKQTGLKRCGKSCRLRWMNYLRPDIKRGSISDDEEELIIRLHKLLGNRWSLIAGRLPGRTDNEIKNYWNSNLAKKLAQDLPPFHSKNNDKKPINTKPSSPSNRVIMVTPQKHTDAHQNHESTNVGVGVVPINNPNLVVKKFESQSSEGSPSTASSTDEGEMGADDHCPNFMMDFNTDEDFCKILDCDFAKLSGVDMNHLSNAVDDEHSHHPILVLPKQIMGKSQLCGGSDEYGDGGHEAAADTGAPDFGSLASFLEADEDWLGNDLKIMLSD